MNSLIRHAHSNKKTSHYFLNRKKNLGFSLLEMIVVLAIISLIASIVLVQNHQMKNRHKLQKAVQEFALNVRWAQGLALETRRVSSAIPAGIPNGFGIYVVNTNSYLIYYNPVGVNDKRRVGASQTYKTVNLDSGLAFSNGITEDVFFLKPNPDCYVNGSRGGAAEQSQNFSIQDSTQTMTIQVTDACKVKIF